MGFASIRGLWIGYMWSWFLFCKLFIYIFVKGWQGYREKSCDVNVFVGIIDAGRLRRVSDDVNRVMMYRSLRNRPSNSFAIIFMIDTCNRCVFSSCFSCIVLTMIKIYKWPFSASLQINVHTFLERLLLRTSRASNGLNNRSNSQNQFQPECVCVFVFFRLITTMAL